MPERFRVEVAPDTFDELCRPTRPLAAVVELVWNGLDAEADAVSVTIDRNDLGAPQVIRVTDDGHGMTHEEAIRDFRQLGGSWKKGRTLSKNNLRTLHGSRGQGRFRAFALGINAEWLTVAHTQSPLRLERTQISGVLTAPEFVVSDPELLAVGRTGTSVTLTGTRDGTTALVAEDAAEFLVVRLVEYLARYSHVVVTYDGKVLDPAPLVAHEETIQLAIEDARPAQVRIREWKPNLVSFRSVLLLCDEQGVALHEITDGISTGDLKLSAYLIWQGFADLADDLLLSEMGHPTLEPVVRAGRQALADYVARRAAEERQTIVDRWKAAKIYPYEESPATIAEGQERQIFDVVAAAAAESGSVPTESKAARLSLRLIKEALERSPGTLHRVFQEVLDLSPGQLADFDQLLRSTRLSAIIQTTKKVVDRLHFLEDLEHLLFDVRPRKLLRERDQLQPMLANQTWIFGEEYALMVSDQSLTSVLAAHLHLFGKDVPILDPVLDTSGKKGTRVDLMLSMVLREATRRKHLVVELKRPSVRLSDEEYTQITKYAFAVATDARFKTPEVFWDFWLVGDEYDDYIRHQVHQTGLPIGVAVQGENYTIRVRRWAELLEENRQRLHFYRDHLEYQAAEDHGLEVTLARYIASNQPVITSSASPS